MPYVKTIPYEDSQGELKEAYNTMTKSCDRITNVQAVSSLEPGIMKTLLRIPNNHFISGDRRLGGGTPQG